MTRSTSRTRPATRASSPTRSRPRGPRPRATASATARTSRASSPATRSTARRSDPLRGKYIGVAPDANLIAVKASDEAGNSTVLDVINGIQFVVDHKAEFNIRVLNLSVSSDTPQSYKTDPLDAAVEYAWQKGIVVVAASGNRGAAADAVKYAPGNDPFVISVGGVDEDGNYGRGARAVWSSTGRTQDGFAKPDVMAPGAHIVSVLAPSSAFLALCPNCAIGGAYFKAGGTSMAAPVVAGAAALLLQARPTLTPDQVKTLLTQTDKPIQGQAGAGEIDVERALFTPTGYTQRQPRPRAEPADPGAQPRRHRPRAVVALLVERRDGRAGRRLGALELVLPRLRRARRSAHRPDPLLLEPQLLVERRRGRLRRGRRLRGRDRRAERRRRGHARRPDPGRRRVPAGATRSPPSPRRRPPTTPEARSG